MFKLRYTLELRLLLLKVPRDQVISVDALTGLSFDFTQMQNAEDNIGDQSKIKDADGRTHQRFMISMYLLTMEAN
jgi:hypothetical protein